MKVRLNKMILIIFQILLGVQWIRITLAMVGLFVLDETELVLGMLEMYYLVMIGFVLCTGFLYLKNDTYLEDKA